MNMKNTIFRNQRKALTSSKKRPQRGFNWVDFEDQNQRQRTESKSSSNFDSNIYFINKELVEKLMDFIEVKLDRDISKIEELSSRNKHNMKIAKTGINELKKKVNKLHKKQGVSLGTEDIRFFKNFIFPENKKSIDSGGPIREIQHQKSRGKTYILVDESDKKRSPFDRKLMMRKSQSYYKLSMNPKNKLVEPRPEQFRLKLKGNLVRADSVEQLKAMKRLKSSGYLGLDQRHQRPSSAFKQGRVSRSRMREVLRKNMDGTYIDTERYYNNLAGNFLDTQKKRKISLSRRRNGRIPRTNSQKTFGNIQIRKVSRSKSNKIFKTKNQNSPKKKKKGIKFKITNKVSPSRKQIMTNIPDRMKMFDDITQRARQSSNIPIIDLLNQVSAISRTRSCKTAEKIFGTSQKINEKKFEISDKIFPNKIYYNDTISYSSEEDNLDITKIKKIDIEYTETKIGINQERRIEEEKQLSYVDQMLSISYRKRDDNSDKIKIEEAQGKEENLAIIPPIDLIDIANVVDIKFTPSKGNDDERKKRRMDFDLNQRNRLPTPSMIKKVLTTGKKKKKKRDKSKSRSKRTVKFKKVKSRSRLRKKSKKKKIVGKKKDNFDTVTKLVDDLSREFIDGIKDASVEHNNSLMEPIYKEEKVVKKIKRNRSKRKFQNKKKKRKSSKKKDSGKKGEKIESKNKPKKKEKNVERYNSLDDKKLEGFKNENTLGLKSLKTVGMGSSVVPMLRMPTNSIEGSASFIEDTSKRINQDLKPGNEINIIVHSEKNNEKKFSKNNGKDNEINIIVHSENNEKKKSSKQEEIKKEEKEIIEIIQTPKKNGRRKSEINKEKMMENIKTGEKEMKAQRSSIKNPKIENFELESNSKLRYELGQKENSDKSKAKDNFSNAVEMEDEDFEKIKSNNEFKKTQKQLYPPEPSCFSNKVVFEVVDKPRIMFDSPLEKLSQPNTLSEDRVSVKPENIKDMFEEEKMGDFLKSDEEEEEKENSQNQENDEKQNSQKQEENSFSEEKNIQAPILQGLKPPNFHNESIDSNSTHKSGVTLKKLDLSAITNKENEEAENFEQEKKMLTDIINEVSARKEQTNRTGVHSDEEKEVNKFEEREELKMNIEGTQEEDDTREYFDATKQENPNDGSSLLYMSSSEAGQEKGSSFGEQKGAGVIRFRNRLGEKGEEN